VLYPVQYGLPWFFRSAISTFNANISDELAFDLLSFSDIVILCKIDSIAPLYPANKHSNVYRHYMYIDLSDLDSKFTGIYLLVCNDVGYTVFLNNLI